MVHKSDGDTNSNWCSWSNHLRIGTRTGWHGSKRISGDHPNYSIIQSGQNTEKSPVEWTWPSRRTTEWKSKKAERGSSIWILTKNKKAMEHEGTVIPFAIGVLETVPKSLKRRLAELETGGRIETIKTTTLLRSARIMRNSPRDVRRLAVTQTLVKNHQLTLVWKTCQMENNNNNNNNVTLWSLSPLNLFDS